MASLARALQIQGDQRTAIIKAVKASKRLFPSKDAIMYLSEQINELSGHEVYNKDMLKCPDCLGYVLRFWKNVTIEWAKKKQ